MKKLNILLILLTASLSMMQAQQESQYTQYMYNTLTINPAYAGSRGVLSISGLHRSQWIGLDGAPKTQTLNFHTPVTKKVGLGFSVVNDEIGNGTNEETNFDGVFSYTISTSAIGKLSFGLKVGGQFLNVNFNQLKNYRPDLANGLENVDKKFSPNIGAGIYYHTDSFYAGLSAPNLLKTEHFDESGENNTYLATRRMNLYLITGYVLDINQKLKFKPALLLKGVNGAPLQADLSANFLFNDRFSLGAAYRWDASVSGLFGFQISDKFMLGLAYDRETTGLGDTQFNDGSFEVFLRYEFLTQMKSVITPRFF